VRDFFSRVTWVDFVVGLALLRGVYIGYRSGFFAELLRLTAYLVTLGVTFHYHKALAEFITLNTFMNQEAATVLAFAVLLIGVFVAAKVVTLLLQKLLKVGEGGFFNRSLGILGGTCRWLLIVSLTFMVIDRSPFTPLKRDISERSITGSTVARVMPMMFDFLSRVSPQLGAPKKDL
jgi:uncharacterized membrane protein required for colicin V production